MQLASEPNHVTRLAYLRSVRGWASLLAVTSILGFGLGFFAPRTAQAEPTLRFKTEDHGSFTIFGNTGGFNCASGGSKIPDPVVGTADRSLCGTEVEDHGSDVLWRSEEPGAGMALASLAIKPEMARTTAVLQLPANASVIYARLYWAAMNLTTAGAGKTVVLERPGGFSKTLTADPVNGSFVQGGGTYISYMSTAEITKEVQAAGPGAFRVGAIPTVDPKDLLIDGQIMGWHAVVFYRLASEPTRSIALFDGFDRVNAGAPGNATLTGLLVPATTFDAKLGVVAYQGDQDLVGDSMSFNGTMLSNGVNPATNFFNGTRSTLGTPISVAGDLPQMSGDQGSMNEMDIDIFDVTSLVKSGDKTATISATTANDTYFLASVVTAVTTVKPVFTETNKTAANLTRTSGDAQPGDIIEYTITTKNTGSDSGVGVVLTDTLPVGVTYVASSLSIVAGASSGNLTDAALDDQGEYSTSLRQITVRLGAGASSTLGGKITTTDQATTVKFRVTVDDDASGPVYNQAQISAQGEMAVAGGVLDAVTWLSGDGTSPQTPTAISVNSSPPDLSIAVSPQPAQDNDGQTYQITVHNNGPTDARVLQVSYKLPDGVEYLSATGDGWSCTELQRELLCTSMVPVAVDADAALLSITVRAPAGGEQESLAYSFKVTGQSASGTPLADPNPANNTAAGETLLAKFTLSGGGFGCTVSGLQTTSLALPGALMALLFAALGLRRRTRA